MMKRLLQIFLATAFLTSTLLAVGQDCNDPTQLCAETNNEAEVLDQLNPLAFNCINANYTLFYSFTTNNSNNNAEGVTVNISNIDCVGANGADLVYATVVSFDPASPCSPALYGLETACESDTLGIVLETDILMPETTYMLILATDHDPAISDCLFDVSIDGEAIDIDACCDANVTLGQSATFGVEGGDNNNGVDYIWSGDYLVDNTGEEISVFPEETTIYQVTGNVAGCVVTDFVTAFIGPPVGIPNAITPNDDGINDLWTITGINEFEAAHVTVFDRWGQVVFNDIGYNEPWDGTNRGRFLPTGTYYYVIELNSLNVNIEPLVGYVAIIH
ncbi:MAG: gliding motility-associated C-terminal domain-containing protein [Flavobacteriales bacterium]|nr:gliding motility-associated C-terminal domain-containing protein [Flavobacteriales bacterium]MDG1765581.1 gliding motility-associated C-terminal domain-containing protein [Flavobacteriales bacterium]